MTVNARIAYDNLNTKGWVIDMPAPEITVDTNPPSIVSDLTSSNTQAHRTDLSWTASDDNVAVTDYEVFNNGESVGRTTGLTALTVHNLISCSDYTFTVVAMDAVGNTSGQSNVHPVRTNNIDVSAGSGLPDPPPIFSNFNYSNVSINSVDLSWNYTDNPNTIVVF